MLIRPALSIGSLANVDLTEAQAASYYVKTRFDGTVQLAAPCAGGLGYYLPRELACFGPETVDMRSEGGQIYFEMRHPPRNEEQRGVIVKSTWHLKQERSHIIEATTGFGKTFCALSIIQHIGRTTLVVTTKDDLYLQWIDAIKKHTDLPEDQIGLVRADKEKWQDSSITISMVHSLSDLEKYTGNMTNYFGLVVFDEVHRMAADTFSRVCYRFPAKLRLGLSATVARVDGKEGIFKAHIGKVLVRCELQKLPAKAIIVRTGCKLPRHVVWKDGKPELVLPYHTADRMGKIYKALAKDPVRNQLVIRTLKIAYARGRTIIVFSHLRGHLKGLLDMTVAAGIPEKDIGLYIGKMKKADREESKTKRVIFATYSMAKEGTDIPQLDTILMTTPLANIVQTVGRMLREHAGKKDPVVFDFVETEGHVLKAFFKKRQVIYRDMKARRVLWNPKEKAV